MDPLHPLLPIQPPAPPRPEYSRVERIARDQPGDPGPDWEGDPEEERGEGQPEQYEDEYDPGWSSPASAEPYGPHGARPDSAPAADGAAGAEPWDPRVHGERRSRPRSTDGDGASEPGPHIDISA